MLLTVTRLRTQSSRRYRNLCPHPQDCPQHNVMLKGCLKYQDKSNTAYESHIGLQYDRVISGYPWRLASSDSRADGVTSEWSEPLGPLCCKVMVSLWHEELNESSETYVAEKAC